MFSFFVLQLFLFELMRKDKKKAVKEIFKRFQSDIITFLKIKLSGNSRLAEEIFQESALSFIKYLSKNTVNFNSDNKIKNYLITIAMNKLKDHFKKEKINCRLFKHFDSKEEFDLFLSTISDNASNPEKKLIDSDQEQIIRDLVSSAMLKLSDSHRNILKLKFFKEKNNSEIASIMNISVKAVESLLFRSKETFKKNFKYSALKDQVYEITEDKNE